MNDKNTVVPSCVSCQHRKGTDCTRLYPARDLRAHILLGARPTNCPGYVPTLAARNALALLKIQEALDLLGDTGESAWLLSIAAALRQELAASMQPGGTVATQLALRMQTHAERLLEHANSKDPDALEGQDEAERKLARTLFDWSHRIERGDWSV